jgi:hypothetical protein
VKKIKTIFARGKNFGVIDELVVDLSSAYATEKVDGTNIRLTIRKNQVVRIEARRNPTKQQKKNGIINAWYRDIDPTSDKWIIDAVNSREYQMPDGEWGAEAYGRKIQNALDVDGNHVFVFSYWQELNKARFDDCPKTYDELKEWLPNQDSKIGNAKIEGIVFYHDIVEEPIGKIKTKDFK